MADYFATGIIAYTGGDRTEAFRNFRQAIRENPNNADAWYWLSLVVDDEERKRDCLLRCLALEPTHASALESLQQLETAAPVTAGEDLEPERAPVEDQPIPFASLAVDESASRAKDAAETDTPPPLLDFGSDLGALSASAQKEKRKVSRGAILAMTVIFVLIITLGVMAVWFLFPGFGSLFSLNPGSLNPIPPAALPSGDSPEGAAANWLNAVLMRRSLDIARYTCLDEQAGMQSSRFKADLIEAITGSKNPTGQSFASPEMVFDLSGLQFTPFEPMELQARVLVFGTLRTTLAGAVNDNPVNDRFTMIHENGRWKWCGSDALNAARIAATQQASAPTPRPVIPPPDYHPGDWRMESIAYQEVPDGEGWKRIQVDLVVENTSQYLGLVQMNSGGRITDLENDYPVEFNFSARVLPGLRTHADRSGVALSLSARVPAEVENLELRIPYRVELIELINSQTAVGEGEFLLYPQQTLSEPANIFINGEWADYQADPPPGIYSAEFGDPMDFNIGVWSFKSFKYESMSADSVEDSRLVLRGVLKNPAQPTDGETGPDLVLTPVDADAIQFLRVNQWGLAALSDREMEPIQVAAGQQEEAEVWSLTRNQVPAVEAETWCFVGFFKAQVDDHIQDLILFSCMPLPQP